VAKDRPAERARADTAAGEGAPGETAKTGAPGGEPSGHESSRHGSSGHQPSGNEPSGHEPSGHEPSGSESSRSPSSGNGARRKGARPPYEKARDELASLVKRLEAGGLTLEQSLELWERGEQLADICEEWLEGARARLAAAVARRDERAGRDGAGGAAAGAGETPF
jgi:exodeoxyribonuclease VII small subunit